MRCLKWHGRHDWTAWSIVNGAPIKEIDGRQYRTQRQDRRCEWCGYVEQKWLPTAVLIEDNDSTPDKQEKQ